MGLCPGRPDCRVVEELEVAIMMLSEQTVYTKYECIFRTTNFVNIELENTHVQEAFP